MPRDAPSHDAVLAPWTQDIEYYCARCGALVTRGRWEMSLNGGHEHVFFNPAGLVFRVLCFRDAPGATAVGAASGVFTWFRGYLWRLCACRGCEAHLGWRYEGSAEPRIFFGLIKDALTTART
ncbi:hypothetical protein A6A04_08780 [Paramagnetospirillum marisnigri]|uniref:CULT domain-containing protein n=1 Tax=Paramagnetospirillum marisnigri TaxID=1285242 RepID=A0A178M6W9_9PROT|nr:cereblon family protein [Paramagnetospirillum marisnigri]OAN43967.1 hypothetical protein A6A04_08780 [Paramagnetospirillum marisnigri]